MTQQETTDKQSTSFPKTSLLILLTLLGVFAFTFMFGFFIWPDLSINQFYPELDKLNYEIYADLAVPQNATLIKFSPQYQDKSSIVRTYMRRIMARYETTLSQDDILDFYQNQLETQGWEHYDQYIFRDNQGDEFYRHDEFRRGTSCIHLATSPVVTQDNDYLLEISHDFWSQYSSPSELVFTVLSFRYERIYFEKCPRSH